MTQTRCILDAGLQRAITMYAVLAIAVDLIHALAMVVWVAGLPLLFVRRLPRLRLAYAMGVAWDRIVETAKTLDVDMIVMGTHGRHGVPRWVLGSVAEKVVRLSPVPVLTVGAVDEPLEEK